MSNTATLSLETSSTDSRPAEFGEIFLGIKIILARLVNHVELMMLGGGLVDDDLVQLS